MENLDNDENLAIYIAKQVAKKLCDLQNDSGLSGNELGDIADKSANDIIIKALKKHRPNDAILSEEAPDNKERLKKERVWIIDPLDGTREYSEGRADWAVHIGLAINNKPSLGVVAIPALRKIYSSDCKYERKKMESPMKMVVSRSRPPGCTSELAAKLNAQMIPMGSAGVKAMAVIDGDADIYFHIGAQKEWDNCAPVAIALANDLHVSRLDGGQITYNNEDVFIEDLLICRKELASRVIDWFFHLKLQN